MKLYIWPGACSLSPHIVAREAGIDLQLAPLDRAERKAADGTVLSSVNPKNQVPTLEMEDGQMLTEGPVIVQYLADLKPAAGLVPPAGSLDRYRVQEWLNFVTSELHKTYGPLFRPTTPDDYKTQSRDFDRSASGLDRPGACRQAIPDGRSIHRRRRLFVHGAALVAARRHRSQQVEERHRVH